MLVYIPWIWYDDAFRYFCIVFSNSSKVTIHENLVCSNLRFNYIFLKLAMFKYFPQVADKNQYQRYTLGYI